jgi:hypothetical protein
MRSMRSKPKWVLGWEHRRLFLFFVFCLHYEDLPSKKAKTMDQLRSSCHLHVPSIREVARMIPSCGIRKVGSFILLLGVGAREVKTVESDPAQ